MGLLLGSLCIGMSLVNLYFVFDGNETMMDLFSLGVFGFAFSMGIISFIAHFRRQ